MKYYDLTFFNIRDIYDITKQRVKIRIDRFTIFC